MKKLTKRQQEVIGLSRQLKPIDLWDTFDSESLYDMENELLDYYSYNSSYYCEGEKVQVNRQAIDTSKTFMLKDVFEENNVERYFDVVCRKSSLNSFPKYSFREVAQNWTTNKRHSQVVLRMDVVKSKWGQGMGEYFINWNKRTKLKFRNDNQLPNYNNNIERFYGDGYLLANLPIFSRESREVFAITNNISYVRSIEFGQRTRGFIAEYFAKHNMLDWLEYYFNHPYSINEYINTIKIAVRHNYSFPSIDDYVDYLRLLTRLSLDLKNPHYICPADFNASREQFIAIEERRLATQRERERRAEDERRRREVEIALQNAAKANDQYVKDHKDYLGIEFLSSDKSIKFHVLQSVQEFVEEGTEMRHCVYKMGYFAKKNSIILSARNAKTDERLATIEISLTDYKILQCFAHDDEVSRFDTKIRNAVNKNIELFKINKAS